MRFRIPEVLLGVLLTVSVLAIGMLAAPYSAVAQKIIGDAPDDRLAFFTLLLALFTFFLAGATVVLAVATQRSVNLAQQQFLASFRPKLVVRGMNYHAHDKHVGLRVTNSGDTAAYLKELRLRYERKSESDPDYELAHYADDKLDLSATLEPGEATVVWGTRGHDFLAQNSQHELLVAASIDYADGRKVYRHIHFQTKLESLHPNTTFSYSGTIEYRSPDDDLDD